MKRTVNGPEVFRRGPCRKCGTHIQYADDPLCGGCIAEMRPLETDFYYDTRNGVWVYKWADSRLVLTTESVLEYQEDRRG